MAGLGPLIAGRMPYTTLLALSFGMAVLRAQRRMDERWEHLVQTYPDRLEDLEVAFGRHLRDHYPEVRSAHAKGRLSYERPDGRRLVLELGEPVRTDLGWGGLRLCAWQGEMRRPLSVSDVFLTLLRGADPEWMARTGGHLLHRLIVVDDPFVTNLTAEAFGA